MNCEEFAQHLMDCLESGTDVTARPEAARHVEACADCRGDAAELPELWERLPLADPGHSSGPTPSARLRERFGDSLEALIAAQKTAGPATGPATESATESAPGTARVLSGPWTRAVVTSLAATLALGLGLGFFFGGKLATSAEIDALRAEMRSVNETVAVALMKHESASERLRGITLSSDNLGVSEGARVIEALFERVRNDPNDNVRVAAVEALAVALDRAEVREGLAASIQYQESPQVQAAVLETLARTDRGSVDRALSSAELDDDVRQWFLTVSPSFIG